jgi:hypothetical protein
VSARFVGSGLFEGLKGALMWEVNDHTAR